MNPAISVTGFTRRYRSQRVLGDVSFGSRKRVAR